MVAEIRRCTGSWQNMVTVEFAVWTKLREVAKRLVGVGRKEGRPSLRKRARSMPARGNCVSEGVRQYAGRGKRVQARA